MTIETKEFGLTPMGYFKIVARNRLKHSWLIYLICVAIAVLSISDFGISDLSTFLVLFGFIYPPFIFVYLYFWTTSNKNKAAFIRKKLTIDSEKIISIDEHNARNEILWKYAIRIVKRNSYWLIYISKGQFIYIPKAAFQSDTDINEFDRISNKMLKNS